MRLRPRSSLLSAMVVMGYAMSVVKIQGANSLSDTYHGHDDVY
jgi:hypothetical protein